MTNVLSVKEGRQACVRKLFLGDTAVILDAKSRSDLEDFKCAKCDLIIPGFVVALVVRVGSDNVIFYTNEATWWMRVRAEVLVCTGTAGTWALAGESYKVREFATHSQSSLTLSR